MPIFKMQSFSASDIHVAHIVIDGAVDAPDTLGKNVRARNVSEIQRDKRYGA